MMNWEALITLGIVVLMLYCLARDVASTDVLLMGTATVLMTLSLASTRFPSPAQIAAGFGNEGLLTVAVLFIVAAGLTETGAIALVSERILGRPRSVVDAQVRMMLPVGTLSAFLNNTPVVAMFMPVIGDWCKKANLSPSKLFIPLSYAAVLGGTCTLIGTSTNLVVQGLMIEAQRTDPAMPRMGMWTISPIGVPSALVGILFVVLVSRRLLPDRKSARSKLSDPREYTVEMLVEPNSSIDGVTIERAGLRHLPGVYLAGIERDGQPVVAVGPDEVLRGNDQLIFVGVVDSVVDLHRMRGLIPATKQVFKLNDPRYTRCLVEAVVSDTCPIVGKTIREGEFRTRYNAAVIAAHRNGERIRQKIGDIVLKPGDTLLLETHARFLKHRRNSRDFFLISHVEGSNPRRHDRAFIAGGIMLAMVVVMAFEEVLHVSVLNAALIAAALMGLTRCLSAEQGRRSIEWPTLVTIGAALGVGKAIETSGLAGFAAKTLISGFLPMGPIGVLAAVYLLTLVFTELITNNAAAALAFPVAHATAATLGLNFMPFAIAVAMAASAGFATPLGYQTHLMVYGAGGYRFSDYVKIGVPLDLLIMLVTVTLTPYFFPFH
jgi:di/tricarboxylate transporter